MKKIRFLLLTLVALLAGVSAQGKTVYIQPNDWANANAVISLWTWGDGVDGSWATLTVVEEGIYKAVLDDAITTMHVVRGPEGNNWDNKWNESGDIPATDGKLVVMGDIAANTYTIEDYTEPVAAGYVVDFNTQIATSNHDFSVASNWKHIVGSSNGDGYGPYYMSYGYSSNGGVDGSGALRVGAQNGYYGGSTQSGEDFTDGHYDYLVTPLVNGTVTLKVKRYAVSGYSSYVKVFEVDDAGTTLGAEITTTIVPDISESEWSTLTLTLSTEQRLAIRAQSVLLDDFTAESATIIKVPGMTITSVKRADSESTTYFDMNADGSYTVKYLVKVKNTGETALVSGTTENYSLSVSIDNVLYGSFNVPVDLAIGETSEEFLATIVLPSTAPTGWKYRYLAENLGGTKDNSSLAWSNTLAYNPVPFFIKQGNEPNSKGTAPTNVTSLNFGMIDAATTLNYEIFAHNAGDLQIKSITVPDGFTIAPAQTLPYTILAHSGMNVDVTADAVASTSGNMVITYVDKNGADATMNVALNQTVVDASKWLATFDDNTWPANTVHQSSVKIYNSTYSEIPYAVTSDYSYSNLFVTPLLTATSGEKFTFDARLSTSTGTVKVYVTKDRSNLGDPVLSLSNSQLNISSFTKQELTIAEAGDYYIAFVIYNAYIDNLYGLVKVDVAHDIMVNSYKIGYYAEDKEIQTGVEQDFNFDILPVQAETADAYSVKLYANDEVVATADAVALTAGANKTLTVKWTPNLTATETFVTYMALEFTDGTKIKSPTLNLKVTCEPIFVFFNAGTTVGSSKPSNRSTAINFGKVNELNLVQNFEIYNYGKANLTVKSITVPEGFSVNVSEAIVEPAVRQAVDVTFSATTPGSYSGNLSIVYVDGEGVDQTFELPVSGTLLDPNKFYATFGTSADASNYPAGSLAQANISLITPTTNNAALNCSSSTKNLFITPLLSGTENETFEFEARARSSWTNGSVKVYQIADNIAAASTTSDDEFNALSPVSLGEFTISGTDFANYSVKMSSTGNYYIALKIEGAYVDEIYGLTPVEIGHKWQIATSNIPTEGMQNYTSTATVNLLNLGLKDEAAEDITVTAYVNGETVATSEGVAMPMNHKLSDEGTQFSVSYMVNKAGTFPVYIEVKAGDYSIATDPVDVVFAEEMAMGDAIQVGTVSGRATANAILDFYNLDGGAKTGDIVYTAAQLNAFGITAGSKIVSIAFKGYASSAKTISNSLTSWVGLKTGDITWNSPDKSTMTQVNIFDGSMPFVSGENLINLDLSSAPIVYDGTSDLRVYFEGTKGGWISLKFDYDNNYKNMRWGGNSTDKANPIAYITLEAQSATLVGKVQTSAAQEIADATITLKADNGVEYSAKTDTEGNYSINVIQAGLDFTATVEAEGYLKREFALNMGGESKTNDVVMYKQFGLVGSLPGLSETEDKLFVQSEEDPNIFTLEMNNVAVTAGNGYWYKLRADGAWQGTFEGGLPDGYQLPKDGTNFTWDFHTDGIYNYKFTFDWANHTLTFERPYTLAEDATGVVALNWVDVTVEREFKAGWNAVVLPFGIESEEFEAAFGENSEVAVYAGDTNDNGNVTVTFNKQSTEYKWIEAGKPYLIWLETPVSGLKFTKDITTDLHPDEGTTFDFVGTFEPIQVSAGDYIVVGGELSKAKGGNNLKAFRSYLQLKAGGDARSVNFVIGEGGSSTEISAAEIDGLEIEGAYNLSGQKVQNLKKGLYIINGKKVFVK